MPDPAVLPRTVEAMVERGISIERLSLLLDLIRIYRHLTGTDLSDGEACAQLVAMRKAIRKLLDRPIPSLA